uniref:Serpin domain-containing protein n=1 Tax=Chelydra serpentina TaxID=8475 RepID=A0A8C3SHW8_CHESE
FLYLIYSCSYDATESSDGQTVTNPPQHLSPIGGDVISENRSFLLAPSNADFAFRFYKQIKLEAADKNVFFSPLSISTAFAMLSLGAKSTTLSQILQGLSFNLTEIEEREIHEGFHHLIHMLNRPDSEIQVNIGNALFIDDQLKLLQKFLEDAKTLYESEAFLSNFQNSAEAEKQINDYIENKTHGKIANLVKDLDPFTVMVLVNYIFFKGKMGGGKGKSHPLGLWNLVLLVSYLQWLHVGQWEPVAQPILLLPFPPAAIRHLQHHDQLPCCNTWFLPALLLSKRCPC